MTKLADLNTAQKAELFAALSPLGLNIGRIPSILIAASNSPAYVKSRADYICTGTDDNILIQSILDGLPVLPDFERSKVLVTGCKYGMITFAPGRYNISTQILFPPASLTVIRGAGVSSWRPIDTVKNSYEGGTQFYSTDPTGRAWQYPQYTGNRTDDGTPNTIPVSGVILEDIEFVVFNPATTQSGTCVSFGGMTTGIVRNVNVFADLTTNTTPRISQGVSFGTGSRSDRKTVAGMHSFFFRDAGFSINTTHFDGSQLVAGNITGGTSPSCFQITQDQNVRLFNLHAFSATNGIKFAGGGNMCIDSVMFESVANPVLIQQTGARNRIKINTVYLNADVTYAGDILDYIAVGWLGGTIQPQIRLAGKATVVTGQTTVTTPHGLIAVPKRISASKTGGGSQVISWTADATNIIFTIPTALGSDLIIDWFATASIND